jgi:hypothetical protein
MLRVQAGLALSSSFCFRVPRGKPLGVTGWGLAHRSFRSQSENDIAARDVPGVHNHNAVIFETCREPMTLILKRARASRSSGQWKDEDYDVLADGKVVGRILESGSRFGPPELRWGFVDHFDLAGPRRA